MSNLQIMSLAMQKAEWLSARQAIVAQNIANANTPSYKAKDISPFAIELQNAGLTMAATQKGHMGLEAAPGASFGTFKVAGDTTYNGNSVALEREMAKLGETNSQYALTTSIIKSFHKMIMTSLKV